VGGCGGGEAHDLESMHPAIRYAYASWVGSGVLEGGGGCLGGVFFLSGLDARGIIISILGVFIFEGVFFLYFSFFFLRRVRIYYGR